MKPALILKEMRELKEAWRRQSFTLTKEQQKRYRYNEKSPGSFEGLKGKYHPCELVA